MKNILLLHGALGCSQQFNPLKDQLQTKGISVFDFNFSGHGGIPFRSDFGIEQFAKETIQFIREHSIQPCSVFGYSMGGYVATTVAIKEPELISSILTFGTKFDWSKQSAEQEVKK